MKMKNIIFTILISVSIISPIYVYTSAASPVKVSDESELKNALTAKEPVIYIENDITVTSTLSIQYDVTFQSSSESSVKTMLKGFYGYLFDVLEGGTLRLSYLTLDGCKDKYTVTGARSLIRITGGTVYLNNGATLKNNYSDIDGGGIYLYGNPSISNKLYMTGSSCIESCESRTTGGAIMVSLRNNADILNISGNTIIKNNKADYGAGIYYRSYVDTEGDTCSIDQNASIIENTAASNGGGIYFYGVAGTASSALELSGNATIEKNDALHGAGIYFNSENDSDRLSITGDVSIVHNTAAELGGGLNYYAQQAAINLTISGASFEENTAAAGGGIMLNTKYGGTASILNTDIENNIAKGGSYGTTGGGIYLQNNSVNRFDIAIDKSNICGNSVVMGHGGGIYYGSEGETSCFLSITDTVISRNASSHNGGGIFISNSGKMEFSLIDNTIEKNTAQNFGSGVYCGNAVASADIKINITDSSIQYNTAEKQGAGLRLSSADGGFSAEITNTTISDNTIHTSGNGGGVWIGGKNTKTVIRGNTGILRNKCIEGNGGGIYFNGANSVLTLKDNVTVSENFTGGTVDLENGIAHSGSGGGICSISGELNIEDNVTISSNTAEMFGGAITATQGSIVHMNDGQIMKNNSIGFDMDGSKKYAGYGGAFYLADENTVLNVNAGTVYENSAIRGGAIYNRTGTEVYFNGQNVVKMNNAASSLAPDIYNEALAYMNGKQTFQFYIENRNAVAKLKNHLIQGSTIQLNLSDYVKPNPEGTSIVVAEATDEYRLLSQTDSDAFLKPVNDFENWGIYLSDDQTQILLGPVNETLPPEETTHPEKPTAPEEYTITYENLMGAKNSNPRTYKSNTPDIIFQPPGPVKGYVFKGWYNSDAYDVEITGIPQGSLGDKIIYARFEKEETQIPQTGDNQSIAIFVIIFILSSIGLMITIRKWKQKNDRTS